MFERYTEKARRVIFFARYGASEFGSPYIEAEHIFLGLMRESKSLMLRLFPNVEDLEKIKVELKVRCTVGPKTDTSVDLPLSNESKRILAYAAEEAERLAHRHIGTEHLFLGMLREERCLPAEILRGRGIAVENERRIIQAQIQASEATQEAVGYTRIRPSSDAAISLIGGAHVVIKRWIEFENEADGTFLGTSPGLDVPQVGHEIVLPEARARVARVVHHYQSGAKPQQLMPWKIVVYVEIL